MALSVINTCIACCRNRKLTVVDSVFSFLNGYLIVWIFFIAYKRFIFSGRAPFRGGGVSLELKFCLFFFIKRTTYDSIRQWAYWRIVNTCPIFCLYGHCLGIDLEFKYYRLTTGEIPASFCTNVDLCRPRVFVCFIRDFKIRCLQNPGISVRNPGCWIMLDRVPVYIYWIVLSRDCPKHSRIKLSGRDGHGSVFRSKCIVGCFIHRRNDRVVSDSSCRRAFWIWCLRCSPVFGLSIVPISRSQVKCFSRIPVHESVIGDTLIFCILAIFDRAVFCLNCNCLFGYGHSPVACQIAIIVRMYIVINFLAPGVSDRRAL